MGCHGEGQNSSSDEEKGDEGKGPLRGNEVYKVAVIGTLGCPYCSKVKKMLDEDGVAYEYIDMSESWRQGQLDTVKRVTGLKTVPQVFVGGELVGGASETEEALNSGKLKKMIESDDGNVGCKGASLPEELQSVLCFAPSEVQTANQPTSEGVETKKQQELRRVEEAGMQALPGDFEEHELIQWLHFEWGEEDRSIFEDLKTHNIIAQFNELNLKWRWVSSIKIVSGSSARPLNSHFIWTGQIDDPVALSEKLRMLILKLYDEHMSPDGRHVDYNGLLTDPKFRKYVDTTAALQAIRLEDLKGENRKCFWINIYNSLIVHALTVVGPAESTLARLSWFGAISYKIGGYVFSANDIEHGILRANSPSPASIWSILGFPKFASKTFSSGDPRANLAMEATDPRIHFALNCGAVSCPPIKVYSPERLEEGLESAAEAFCQDEVEVHFDRKEVVLSSIFKWYGKDFGETKGDLIRFIIGYVSDDTRQKLSSLLRDEKDINLIYKKYDWSTNSK